MAVKKKNGSVALKVILVLLALFIAGGVFLFFFWDRTPPEVIPVDQTVEYGGKLKIDDLVEANDNRSKKVALTFDSVSPEEVEVSQDGTLFTFPKVGEYTIKITGRDDFKNNSEAYFGSYYEDTTGKGHSMFTGNSNNNERRIVLNEVEDASVISGCLTRY